MRTDLRLDRSDPRALAAEQAEARLYADYGLAPEHHLIPFGGSDMRLRVSIVGSGPPLVIVPGNTGDAFPLIPLMASLPGRRLIAINRPGGGLSDGMDHRTVEMRAFAVETLAGVIEHFGLKGVDVMAHSIGAHWCFWLAMDRPDLVGRLVTLGNPGNVMKGGAPLVLRLLTKPPFSWLLAKAMGPKDGQANLAMLRRMGHDPAALDKLPASFGGCYGAFRRLPNYMLSLLSLFQNLPKTITGADIAKVPQPVALIWGTEDTFAGSDTARSIAEALPQGELHLIEGAGHLPWLKDPRVCGRLVMEFLGKSS